MVKKITLARIIQRLIGKFDLVESAQEDLNLSETVVPITDIDKLIAIPKIATKTQNYSGAGIITVFTVPDGKRWTVYNISKNTATPGGGHVVYISAAAGSTDIALWATTTAVAFVSLPGGIIMEAGWVIEVYHGGTDANIKYSVLYSEEDAY